MQYDVINTSKVNKVNTKTKQNKIKTDKKNQYKLKNMFCFRTVF